MMLPLAFKVALVAVCVSGCAHKSVRTSATQAAIQEPLGTRARIFAEYVVAMHRRIHKLFTLGFLADIDARKDPTYADEALWTQLGIVINADGSVDHVGIIRRSGLPAFDVAAIDSVSSAAPFPPPPQVIQSANGKLYVDWQFHRDERGCGAFGVTPHIYGTVDHGTEHELSEAIAHAQPRMTQEVRSDASEAHLAADGWFAAYVRRDDAWLAGWSAIPFTAEGEVIARDAATLKKFYRELVAAQPTGNRAISEIDILTPTDIRQQLGRLPPGGEPANMLYVVGHVSGEEFTLLLKRSSQGWRVCGVNRRSTE